MWLSPKIFSILEVAKEAVDAQRTEVAALRAENLLLKDQLAKSQIQFDWVRMQINSLQMERTQLVKAAYGISLPTPELAKVPVIGLDTAQPEFSFEDIGDELAHKFGLPVYGP